MYHVQCHRCTKCGRHLAQGEQIVVDEQSQAVACTAHFLDDERFRDLFREQQNELASLSQQIGQKQNAQLGEVFGQPSTSDQSAMQLDIGNQNHRNGHENLPVDRENAFATATALPSQQQQQLQKEAQIEQELAAGRRLSQMLGNNEIGQFEQFLGTPLIQMGPQQSAGQNIVQSSSCCHPLNICQPSGDGTELAQQILARSVLSAQQENLAENQLGIGQASLQNCKTTQDSGLKKKKSKAKMEGQCQQRGKRTSCTPPIPVPQYPFEVGQNLLKKTEIFLFWMYAAGEQFSRQEEESQQKAAGNKRRGPRTTISQQQVSAPFHQRFF